MSDRLPPRTGPRITRRLEAPTAVGLARHPPGPDATALADAHNAAVRSHGSDSGGTLAFNPHTRAAAGVFTGEHGYPADTIVTRLAWGRITPDIAQALLEGDGLISETGTLHRPPDA